MATKTKKKVNLRPLHDKILVERDEPTAQTAAGIFLPESSRKKPTTATVLAVGEGKINEKTGERMPLSIKVGDRIILPEWRGTEITLDGEDYLIVDSGEILAIVD